MREGRTAEASAARKEIAQLQSALAAEMFAKDAATARSKEVEQLLSAEMNYFAEMVEMPFVKGEFCVVSMGTSRSLAPGRLSIHLYPSRVAMQECVVRERCPAFRSVNLLPRTGNGVYRSYFLSDMDRKMIAQHCVTSKGKWHPDTTCYTVD